MTTQPIYNKTTRRLSSPSSDTDRMVSWHELPFFFLHKKLIQNFIRHAFKHYEIKPKKSKTLIKSKFLFKIYAKPILILIPA